MNLAKKIALLLGSAFAVLFAGLYGSSRTIVLHGFASLEKEYLERDVRRAVNVILRDVDGLDTTDRDYSAWDDTCAFIDDGNAEYAAANLVESVFQGNRLSLVLYVNREGRVTTAKGYDLDTGREVQPSADVVDALAADARLGRHANPESAAKGLVLLGGRPFMVSSRPILTSDAEGPVKGALIMARELGGAITKELGDIAQVSLVLTPWDAAARPGILAEARAALAEGKPVFVRPRDSRIVSGFTLLRDINGKPALVAQVDAPRGIYRQGRATLVNLLAALLLVGAVLVLVILGLLSRVVLRPLKRISGRMQDIAQGEGDLTQRIRSTARDEIGDLGRWFDVFVGRIEETVRGIRTHSSELASSAQALAENAGTLCQGAREQAGQMAEAAAATAEISASVAGAAAGAKHTAETVRDSAQRAERGREAVERVARGMTALAQRVQDMTVMLSSMGKNYEQIGQMLTLIEDISDQTNLLSLNAAIEAARAGEAGRGFAVVADEVRKLADRTTRVTRQIGDVIARVHDDSTHSAEGMELGMREVEEGLTLVDLARSSLDTIVEASSSSAILMDQIVASADEQSIGTELVAARLDSVADIARGTEGTASSIDDATERLAHLATQLHGTVSRFQVDASE